MKEVTDLIAELPPAESLIARKLRSLILDVSPRLREKISYGVPYFYHHRRVCFLWPVSCLPCGITKYENLKVTLGFCYGNMLSNNQGLLIAENRKQARVIPYHSIKEIDERLVTEIVHEAILVDDEFGKRKKRK